MALCDRCVRYPCTDDDIKLLRYCPAFEPKKKPMTNADRIRSMTDEELARFIWQPDALMIYVRRELNTPPYIRYSEKQVLDWLRQEAAGKDGAE